MTEANAFPLEPGLSVTLRPGLRRILAPNPSAFTGPGTNSYIVGEGHVALIDPGPDDPRHTAALLDALAPGEVIEAIIVTHAHRDHTALVAGLAARTGAPVLAFGDATAGQNPVLAALGDLGDGEGVDFDFRPDRTVVDGEMIHGRDWTLEVIHTPGHLGNHICLGWDGDLFSGDHAMGWSTSIVSPPSGDMSAYMVALDRLIARAPGMLFPGHGPEVVNGTDRLRELAGHRRQREAQISAALAIAPGSADELAARIYTGLDPRLLPAAARNVLAHLLDLEGRGLAVAGPGSRVTTRWQAADV